MLILYQSCSSKTGLRQVLLRLTSYVLRDHQNSDQKCNQTCFAPLLRLMHPKLGQFVHDWQRIDSAGPQVFYKTGERLRASRVHGNSPSLDIFWGLLDGLRHRDHPF